MDFPEFFSLTKVNDFIKSSRWRGLAVLSSPVNAGQQLDRVDPVTGDRCTDRDVALHVLTKPMLTINSASIGGTLLAAKPGVRYYIHSVTMSVRLIAADTTTLTRVAGTFQGTSYNFAVILSVPSVASAQTLSVVCDILADENTAITTAADVAPTAQSFTLNYCEVGSK